MGIGHWPAALPLHAAPQNAGTSADEVTIGGWQRVFLALRCQEKVICPLSMGPQEWARRGRELEQDCCSTVAEMGAVCSCGHEYVEDRTMLVEGSWREHIHVICREHYVCNI